MRVRLAALFILVGGLTSLMTFDAAALPPGLAPCPEGDFGCARLTVPLDRSGAVAGSVRLHLEGDLEGALSPAPPVLAIGGAPGQATTAALSAASLDWAIDPGSRGPGPVGEDVESGRRIVVMDLRGTGKSSALRCRALELAAAAGVSEAAAACAAALGARRGFYTARDSAEDVEAVRQALGVDKIALLGVEYGARVALAYTRRHPDRVDRLLLQSPQPPEGGDLLYRSTFAAIPAVVREWCGRACRRASLAPVADAIALGQRLERGPIGGPVIDAAGRRRHLRLHARDLFEALGGGRYGGFFLASPGDMPGMLRNAARGDVAPLLRARESARWYTRIPSESDASLYFSAAAAAASLCEESVLPWPRAAALEDRDAAASAFAFGLPPRAFHPFGPRAALASDLVALCRKWPVASAAPDAPTALPAIPTLVTVGTQSLAAPVAHARAVAQLVPGARLLRLRGFASERDLDVPTCVQPMVDAFFAGRALPSDCSSPVERVPVSAPPPLSPAEVDPEPGMVGRAGRTLAAVRLTLRDGAATIPGRFFVRVVTPGTRRRDLYGTPVRVGALRHGTYRLGFHPRRFALRDASYVQGVRVSGSIAPFDRDNGASSRGHLRVGGPSAVRGRLVLRGRVLSGRLGGRPVRTRIGDAAYPDVSFGR